MTHKFDTATFGDEVNIGNILEKKEAEDLLNDWVDNPKLKLHMHQVAHLLKEWASQKEGLSKEEAYKWWLTGLLHDADWDKWPEEHCSKIIRHLEEKNVDPEIIRGIASHGPIHFGVDPVSRLDHMIYAFDELSGFVHAVSLVRGGYDGMKNKSVKKKLKTASFAAQVNREEINDAASRAGIELDDLIAFVIENQIQEMPE